MNDVVTGLALDGGGVFGIGQAAVLAKVDLSKFDFIAGTSVGSLTATMVAQGTDQALFVPIFQEIAPKIFAKQSFWAKAGFTPKYPDTELNKALQSYAHGSFGDMSKPMFITAAAVTQRRLKVFYTEDEEDALWPAWEVCRAATGAETVFLPWKGYADGAIYANNPAAVLAAGMVRDATIKAAKIKIVSIGTGDVTTNEDTGSTFGWHMLKWGTYILDTLLGGGGNSMHEYLARTIVKPENFLRVNFRREPDWRFTNPADMSKALKAWGSEIDAAAKAIEGF